MPSSMPVEGAEKKSGGEESPWLEELTPRQIVAELDKYIVGQTEAKKAVAIALRNRWRRQRVPEDLRDEIMPNNIIMIGPTGVGKTEIARRLARLAGAPFVKVEASKFTEVGYVGRDVESMIRDLADVAINLVRNEREEEVQELAEQRVEERILDLLIPPLDGTPTRPPTSPAAAAFVVSASGEVQEQRAATSTPSIADNGDSAAETEEQREARERRERTREKLRGLLRDEKLEEREVEVR